MGIEERRQRERLHRRSTILAAAKELFREKGYEATMDEIAERAELSKPTLYHYFRNKDDLYVSIVLDGFEAFKEKLKQIAEGGAGIEERARSFFTAFVDFCMEDREHFRITQYVITEYARDSISDDLSARIKADTSELLGYGAHVIQEGIDSGLIRRDVDPLALAIVSWRTAMGLLDIAVEDTLGGWGSETYSELFDLAITLLMEGAKAPPKTTGRGR
jgi:TetR/AcrR family transcriptional regulator